MNISHTAMNTYKDCPKKYELKYIQNIRSPRIGSALLFGSALDEAFNELLLGKTLEEANAKFIDIFTTQKIEGVETNISKDLNVDYYASDYDSELYTHEDIGLIISEAYKNGLEIMDKASMDLFFNEVKEIKKSQEPQIAESIVFNYMCWLSLKRKGEFLLEEYNRVIIPQIEKVYNVQETINLEDEEDCLIGVIDFEAKFKNDDNIYICDNKTSSIAYKDDSVQTSDQLAIYSEYKANNNCAFIVVEKKLRKREPRSRIYIIKDVLTEVSKNKTFDKITETLHNIKEGFFPEDPNSCFMYGKKCEYYNLCKYGLMDGLYKKEKSSVKG